MKKIIKVDLKLKPFRMVKAQRVTPQKAAKRLAACEKWKAQIESGELDLKAVYWTDEKIFRLGALKGGNQNLVVYVKNDLKKSEVPNNLILRGDGVWQGGVHVMVSLGLCFSGVGTLRYAPKGGRLNGPEYLEIVNNTYLPDCHKYYGVPPTCVFMQDGASCHTSNAVQEFCAKKFPKFWGKLEWPPCSPDLNPLDFFAWGYLQSEVDKKKPKCLDSLKLAIRECVEALPLDMVQKAMLNFYPRVCLCIESGGGAFKHKKIHGGNPLVGVEINNNGESDGEEGEEIEAGEGEAETGDGVENLGGREQSKM